MTFTKRDVFSSLLLGEIVAWLSLMILKNLEIEVPGSWSLPIVLPILVLGAMYVACLVGRKIRLVWQLAKFGSVGVLNTLVDWGILNFLIFFTQIASGFYFSVFKGISFVAAVINSYLWNKFWTFSAGHQKKEAGKEFLQFFVVSIIGFLINVGSASFLVNYIGAPSGIDPKLWANAGALLGSVLGMTGNFLGYKLVVFRKPSASKNVRGAGKLQY